MDDAERLKYERECLARWLEVKGDCKKWHEKIAHYQRLYDLKHYQNDPAPKPQEERITLSAYTNAVDLAVGILSSNELVYTVTPAADTPEARALASLQEQFLDGVLYVNDERQECDLRYDWTLRQLRDGAVGLRTYWDNEHHRTLSRVGGPEGEVWVFGQLPLVVQVIPAENLYPKPGGRNGRWQFVFYAQERSVYDVEVEHGLELPAYRSFALNDKRLRKSEYLDYWAETRVPRLALKCPDCGENRAGQMTCEHCGSANPIAETVEYDWAVENAILFEGKLIAGPRIMNGYADLPYTLLFCKPIGGKKPEEWTHSLVTPIDEPVHEKEKLLNRQRRQLNADTARPLITKTRDGRQVQIDAAFGTTVSLTLEEDIGFPPAMGTPEDMKYQLAQLDAEIQQGSFPAAMYGEGPSQSSGYALALLGDAGRIRLTQPVKQQEQMLAIVARKCQSLLAHFAPDAAIEIYGARAGQPYTARLTGADMQGCRISVKLEPQYPNDMVRKVAVANQLRGILSTETLMETYLGVHQPDQEKRRILTEIIEKHPVFVEFQLTEMLSQWAALGDEAAAQVLERIRRQGVQGKPGPEAGPQNLEQAPGQPSAALGQFPPQAAGGVPPGQELNVAAAVPPIQLLPGGPGA